MEGRTSIVIARLNTVKQADRILVRGAWGNVKVLYGGEGIVG